MDGRLAIDYESGAIGFEGDIVNQADTLGVGRADRHGQHPTGFGPGGEAESAARSAIFQDYLGVFAQLAPTLVNLSFDDQACPVIALMNMKGGVGKTTIASQVFASLQKARRNRVLLIDLDPQHNLSQLFFRRSTQDTLVYMDASVISLFEPSALQDQPSPAENWHLINMVEATVSETPSTAMEPFSTRYRDSDGGYAK